MHTYARLVLLLTLALAALAAGIVAFAAPPALLFTLNTANPQAGGQFGNSLAVGDVNGDSKGDIAVGAYQEDVGGPLDQGRAYVFSGANGSLLFTLDTPNPQTNASFGGSLAVGDVNGDAKRDIAVGAHGALVGGNAYQGRAYVFSGADGSLLFTLDTPNPQAYAEFGMSVAVGDVNNDGNGDIAAGGWREDEGGNDMQGRAYVFSSPPLPPVGGVAELPDVAQSGDSSAATYAALAGGLAAALVALTAGAWYARRRWGR